MNWYALYVLANCERLVVERLKSRGAAVSYHGPAFGGNAASTLIDERPAPCQAEPFYPSFGAAGKPLFPGYVFASFDLATRYQVLDTPFVLRILGDYRGATPIPDDQIENMRILSARGLSLEVHPITPELSQGEEIVVRCGSFAGMRGRVVRFRGQLRVSCSIDAMGKTVLTELDVAWLRPTAA